MDFDVLELPEALVENLICKQLLNPLYIENSLFVENTLNQSADIYYNASFYPLDNNESKLVQEYIKDNKTLNHDILDLLEPDEINSHICFFKNKYSISCTIIPQSSLTEIQKSEVKRNIENNFRF